jgi:ABC-type antimicrobial peptide transport system permease subunit
MMECLTNPSFLLFLGILMMTVSFLVIYFEGKMREQNHKISSMLSLVYSLAENLNDVTAKVKNVTSNGNESLDDIQLNNSLEEPIIKINITNDNLIHVSDNEDSDEEDDEEDEEEEDVSDEEEEDVSDEYNEYLTNNIKILKIDLNNINEQDINDSDLDIEFNENITQDLDIEVLKNEETQPTEEETDFKTTPNNLEDNLNDTLDFKKLSLQKLRHIVTEKGLTTDANKLKKNELLKLLGME